MSDTFVPYRDRPALDKGARISWTDLESGMLFDPLAGSPTPRRVRGVPQFIWYGEHRSPSFMVGSEDAADGRPCGGVIGVASEFYVRRTTWTGYEQQPVYVSDMPIGLTDEELIERLRTEFTAKITELEANPPTDPSDTSYQRRLQIARQNLVTLEEGR